MTTLLTGGAGYIGSHCAWAFEDHKRPFVVLDDLSRGHRHLIPQEAPFYQGKAEDAALFGQMVEKHGIDTVIHLAGSTVVAESCQDPGAYFYNNTSVSLAVIQACLRHGVNNIIFSSSASVYGHNPKHLVCEDEPVNPQSPYAESKWMTECMLNAFHKAHGMNIVNLRYFNVAGADPHGRTGQHVPNTTHLVQSAIDVALGHKKVLHIFGTDYNTPDGTGVRDYIHVSDLAEAHVCALDFLRKSTAPGYHVFNCGYGTGYSVREVIRAVEAVTGTKLPVHEALRRLGDPEALMADATRFRQQTPWRPRFDNLETLIRTALAWEKAKGRHSHEHVS